MLALCAAGTGADRLLPPLGPRRWWRSTCRKVGILPSPEGAGARENDRQKAKSRLNYGDGAHGRRCVFVINVHVPSILADTVHPALVIIIIIIIIIIIFIIIIVYVFLFCPT